jgi:hypothetical protein
MLLVAGLYNYVLMGFESGAEGLVIIVPTWPKSDVWRGDGRMREV